MNEFIKMVYVFGRNWAIISNIFGGSLNLLAYAVTNQKKHLFWTIGSATIVLLLNSKNFKEMENEVNERLNNSK